jgi:prepilin-type N-terminal cleavage/methylation domain-containing protein
VGNKQSGFTLIEVVLVLAIAGLVFLIALLALNAGQRAARDNQRKQELAGLVAAIQQWRANNLGKNLDTDAEVADLQAKYFSGHNDPSTGTQYQIINSPATDPHWDTIPPPGQIIYAVSHVCGSDADRLTYVTVSDGYVHNIRQFAVLLGLEASGVYCLDVR